MWEIINVVIGLCVFLFYIVALIYGFVVALFRPIVAWNKVKIGDVYVKKGKKNKNPFKHKPYEDDKYYHIKDIKNGYILFEEIYEGKESGWEHSYHWYQFFAFICDVGSRDVKKIKKNKNI